MSKSVAILCFGKFLLFEKMNRHRVVGIF